MAASTASHAATSAFVAQTAPVRRKKSHKNLYIGLASGGVAFLAVIIFWHQLSDLTHKIVHSEVVAGPPPPPTNVEPPPPPELTAEEILQNVSDKYKSFSSYAVKGASVAAIDISGIKPGAAIQNSSQAVSLELGRTNFYRLQWQRTQPADPPYKGAAWNAGKGDFVGYGPYPGTKMKSREVAMTTADSASEAQCIDIAKLFFDDTNSFTRFADAFARTNGPTLNPQVNGHNCYVIDGQFDAHDLVIWVDKKNFIVEQIQFVFGGKVDDAKLKQMPVAMRNQYTIWSKLKGTITETYNDPDVDKPLVAANFEAPFSPVAIPGQPEAAAAGVRRQPQLRENTQRGASPTSPTQLTRRVRPDGGQ
jgi:hypothetical protein